MAVAVSGGVFFVHYQRDIQPRLATIFHGDGGGSDAGSGRLIIWPAAWEAFSHHPYTGVGYGVFVRQSIDRMFNTRGTNRNFKPIRQEPHNTFLGALAELGAPDVLLLGLLSATILQLNRVAGRARAAGDYLLARYSHALVIGIVAWCVGVFWISAETSRPISIVIGLSLAFPRLLWRPVRTKADVERPVPSRRNLPTRSAWASSVSDCDELEPAPQREPSRSLAGLQTTQLDRCDESVPGPSGGTRSPAPPVVERITDTPRRPWRRWGSRSQRLDQHLGHSFRGDTCTKTCAVR